jgi:hypothetical protein
VTVEPPDDDGAAAGIAAMLSAAVKPASVFRSSAIRRQEYSV